MKSQTPPHQGIVIHKQNNARHRDSLHLIEFSERDFKQRLAAFSFSKASPASGRTSQTACRAASLKPHLPDNDPPDKCERMLPGRQSYISKYQNAETYGAAATPRQARRPSGPAELT